jgi:hypothetical protein
MWRVLYKRRERYCRNLWKMISEEKCGGKGEEKR